jgi:hypothetical protein
MYMIENFGGWILDTRRGMFFGIVVLMLTMGVLWKTKAPSLTTLSSKEFECSLAIPDGLNTKCIEYVYKGSK